MSFHKWEIKKGNERRKREGNRPFLTKNLRSTVLDEGGLSWALQTGRISTAKYVEGGRITDDQQHQLRGKGAAGQ